MVANCILRLHCCVAEKQKIMTINLMICLAELLYFFAYKAEFFSFQNNPKDLDPSCKTDLDLWDCLGRVILVL